MASNFGKFYDRLNDIGFQDVHVTENPSGDFVQAKITELLNDPEVTNIRVNSDFMGQESQVQNQGGFPCLD